MRKARVPLGRPSDRILWLTATGPERGLGGQRLSRPRPRLWSGARWHTRREWAMGPILTPGCFRLVNSKEIEISFLFSSLSIVEENVYLLIEFGPTRKFYWESS
jgi:hypothetical protein